VGSRGARTRRARPCDRPPDRRDNRAAAGSPAPVERGERAAVSSRWDVRSSRATSKPSDGSAHVPAVVRHPRLLAIKTSRPSERPLRASHVRGHRLRRRSSPVVASTAPTARLFGCGSEPITIISPSFVACHNADRGRRSVRAVQRSYHVLVCGAKVTSAIRESAANTQPIKVMLTGRQPGQESARRRLGEPSSPVGQRAVRGTSVLSDGQTTDEDRDALRPRPGFRGVHERRHARARRRRRLYRPGCG
jgi:hypothetical protein